MKRWRSRPLEARDAYPLWAARYDAENPVTVLDQLAVAELTPPLAGRRLLDAACGTGRRLATHPSGAPSLAVGADLARDMLRAGRRRVPAYARLLQADVRRLPLGAGTVDVIWCRLALGHLRELRDAYEEFRRVAAAGGTLVVTDFHAAALRAGHRRTFRDAAGRLREVASFAHTPEEHTEAARAAGFSDTTAREYCVGPSVRTWYEEANSLKRYEEDLGLPLVFGLACSA